MDEFMKRSRHRHMSILPMLLALMLVALGHNPAYAWWNDDWAMRKKITIDTSPSGANITDPIGGATVLVRLHVSNFRFSAAKEDGSDLRFVAGDDKTPLKHHIEKYDSMLGEALVWVRVPEIKPGAKTEIWLYYGNQKAQVVNDARGSYDADTLVVYHFNDKGVPAQDATAWNNNARNAVPSGDGAIIGQGARFDGQVSLAIPQSSSFASADGSEATLALWIKPASAQPGVVLFSRSEGPNGLTLGLDAGIPFVEIKKDGAAQRAAGPAAVEAGSWHHLALVSSSSQTILYLDGNASATLPVGLPALTGDAQLGGPVSAAADAATAGSSPDASQASPDANASSGSVNGAAFVGDIDEFSLSKVARPLGLIRLDVLDQGGDHGKLVTYSVDEETTSWFSGGYFGVILRSVTVDGWVVIGLLGIMAVLSWFVMVDRVRYLGRSAKSNEAFLKYFKESEVDALFNPDGIDTLSSELRKTFLTSPLFRLFDAAQDEMGRRGAATKLTAQAMSSIRAVLDGVYVREVQRLNRQMVILTIAISGGPFLGLLGTVVGVMITFAAIAQSGDVNINAIAPGIAAALVATVAGLAVAIPALFAYNYLTIKIKDTTSELQVFVDEVIALIGEWSDGLPVHPTRIAAE